MRVSHHGSLSTKPWFSECFPAIQKFCHNSVKFSLFHSGSPLNGVLGSIMSSPLSIPIIHIRKAFTTSQDEPKTETPNRTHLYIDCNDSCSWSNQAAVVLVVSQGLKGEHPSGFIIKALAQRYQSACFINDKLTIVGVVCSCEVVNDFFGWQHRV